MNSLMELHLIPTEYNLPYGITQCQLPPVTSTHTPPPQPDRPVLDLPTLVVWKAELTNAQCLCNLELQRYEINVQK